MSAIVNIHEAKTQFSKLVERVQAGEEIIIARNGEPVARLAQLEQRGPREPGGAEGLMTMRDDFDDPLPDALQRAFGQQ